MVSEDYGGVDGPEHLSNAVQVNEPQDLIWTRVIRSLFCQTIFPSQCS
jgi:hypothetical protein